MTRPRATSWWTCKAVTSSLSSIRRPAWSSAGCRCQGCQDDHSLALDSPARLAFIACDVNSALLTVDMNTWRVTGTAVVGVEPDVLAFDGRAGRLYMAAESGWVTVLQRHGQRLRVIYSNYLANDAHVVTVDQASGRSYFPVLSASGGHPAVLVCEIT
jgi:hypothetical protein